MNLDSWLVFVMFCTSLVLPWLVPHQRDVSFIPPPTTSHSIGIVHEQLQRPLHSSPSFPGPATDSERTKVDSKSSSPWLGYRGSESPEVEAGVRVGIDEEEPPNSILDNHFDSLWTTVPTPSLFILRCSSFA